MYSLYKYMYLMYANIMQNSSGILIIFKYWIKCIPKLHKEKTKERRGDSRRGDSRRGGETRWRGGEGRGGDHPQLFLCNLLILST